MEVHSRSNTRRHPRFKLDANLKIRSRSEGLLNGYALDLSESGMAAMLVMEVSIGQVRIEGSADTALVRVLLECLRG